MALTAPWAKTISSLEVRAWNLLGAVTKLLPVRAEISSATFSEKPSGAFRPVPTAVPPRASSDRGFMASLTSSTSRSRELRQPLISWEKAIGTASCRWVLPLLTIPSCFSSRTRKAAISFSAAGIRRSSRAVTAEMCMAVGKVSLEDWLMLMSSLGWQSLAACPAAALLFCPAPVLPACPSAAPAAAAAISLARLAMTSLAFMLDWVPDPVCQTTRGKWSISFPSITSSAACEIAASFSSVIFSGFKAWLARAAAFFRMPKARMISAGMVSIPTPIGKFSWLRSVCAAQYLSAGTFTSPMESCSILYSIFSSLTANDKESLYLQ